MRCRKCDNVLTRDDSEKRGECHPSECAGQSYRFYWLHGKVDQGYGRSVADAFSKLGFGGGAMRALDFYEELDEGPSEYAWVEPGSQAGRGEWHNFVLARSWDLA